MIEQADRYLTECTQCHKMRDCGDNVFGHCWECQLENILAYEEYLVSIPKYFRDLERETNEFKRKETRR
jgi:hypothetical protein